RFHLWQNLGQAVEKTVNTLRVNLAAPVPAAAPPVLQPPRENKLIARLRSDYEAVQELYRQGWSKAAIGRKLQLHQATVRKFANARCVEDVLAKNQQRASIVDEHVEYLHQRWNEGEHNATHLFREIRARGYRGGELAVQRYLRRYRHASGPAPKPGPRPPSVREVTSWIMTDPDHLTADDTKSLKAITRRDADLRRLTGHVREFATMMVRLEGHRLDDWIAAVEVDRLAPLASFARNLRRDIDAVRNGLTLPFSSGPVEGCINRIKMLKRQMFGRANIDLLRKRTLLSA
ncbi:transposase, partial [Catellatospora sp. NPDC049609]|uniref:transposase n=1 Tax=Catellatospora sp. NPDC049609 TaxID=3155505 RepID=UPI0034489EAE